MTWLSRSLPLLIVGLVVLAIGLFVDLPTAWSYVVAIVGVAILVAWAIGFPIRRDPARRAFVERRQREAQRRQRATEVRFERRYGGERRTSAR
jgi:hypothetical protein